MIKNLTSEANILAKLGYFARFFCLRKQEVLIKIRPNMREFNQIQDHISYDVTFTAKRKHNRL